MIIYSYNKMTNKAEKVLKKLFLNILNFVHFWKEKKIKILGWMDLDVTFKN